jgi:hypothetical protein
MMCNLDFAPLRLFPLPCYATPVPAILPMPFPFRQQSPRGQRHDSARPSERMPGDGYAMPKHIGFAVLGLGCCDTCDTRNKFLGVERLRQSRHLRHWARSWGLCRGCRRSRRGLPCDFHKFGVRIKPHGPYPLRCANFQLERIRAPLFPLPTALAIRVFLGCPAMREPWGFRAVGLALAAPHRAPEPRAPARFQ